MPYIDKYRCMAKYLVYIKYVHNPGAKHLPGRQMAIAGNSWGYMRLAVI